MAKNITYLINESEISAGTRGASLGPKAIMTEARNEGSRLFGESPCIYNSTMNHLLDQSTTHSFAKRIDGLIPIYETVSTEVSKLLLNNRFPLILSGDHGSAGATIAGIKATFPQKRLGVIWIDAHGDLHTPYTTPSGNMHGMPLALALCEDNKVEQRNVVPQNTIDLWNKLKNIGYKGAKVKPEDIVFIGLRDIEPEESALIDRFKMKIHTVAALRTKGTELIVNEIQQQLSTCDLIYVSFDVDSMDPDQTSYGTGTPVKNGIFIDEAKQLLNAFAMNPKLICMEFVEVNPCLDEKKNKMANVTFQLIKNVVELF